MSPVTRTLGINLIHPPSFDDGRPPFDHSLAQALVGKLVLVGVTYENRRGETIRHEQMFGRVVSADAHSGITLELEGTRKGEQKRFPPTTEVYQEAPKGEYRLKSTGEIVIDPDYTATWTTVQTDA